MSGIYFNPLKRIFLNLSGGTVTGDTIFTQGLSSNTFSSNTISGSVYFSGFTPLEIIINNIAAGVVSSSASTLATYVQPGSNIITGGTPLSPVISIVNSPSFNSIYFSGSGIGNSFSATTLSGGTIYSAGTDLYNIFLTTHDGNDITRVQPGSNITTGGTGNFPIINLIASPSINGLTISGTGTANIFSATTLSGSAIYLNGLNVLSETDLLNGGLF